MGRTACTEPQGLYKGAIYLIFSSKDKIRNEDIRQELEISGIQDVRLKYKQNWINHLERMDNTRLPKYALTHKPRGRRDRGRPRKRWQRVDAGTGQTT
jgi:predicted ArsR family transcriptional regulator